MGSHPSDRTGDGSGPEVFSRFLIRVAPVERKSLAFYFVWVPGTATKGRLKRLFRGNRYRLQCTLDDVDCRMDRMSPNV